jgi:diaminopimelate decarboxylase
MPKKKVIAAEAAPETPVEETKPEAVEPKAQKKTKQTSFDVINAGGTFIRTYSAEDHGEEAEDLANQYAKKIGGTVK